ncbi:MAG: NAD(P)-dependent glycerol-3-phosphate dehydrogenase [Lachnospiraceae bacterium]|nr:NAD(P)-dependent glycerol-3-phosphate dehydrogenase [Lachnospiraceae bacterium]
MARIGVLGGGTWGIALSVLLCQNGHEVTVWSAVEKEIQMLRETHAHKMLPGVTIPEEVTFTMDDAEAVRGKSILVMAVASSYTRKVADSISSLVAKNQIIVNVAKGIEESSMMTLTQVIEEEIPQADVAVLSGPSHAEEVGRGLPTSVVVGAKSRETAEYIQNVFMSPVFRVYTSPDVLGIELGSSLKNVVALAAGIADGLGYGDNAKAALITRGITEISRLGTAMGGRAETFSGLTGIGDLIVTCASMHSRNRRAGILIGQGKSYKEAMDEVQQVVEGVYSAKAAMKLAKKYGVSLPIIEQVNKVLFEGKNPAEAVKELMLRDKKSEVSVASWT